MDMLENVVFVIFILACVALFIGTLFEHGCIPIPETEHKHTVLAKEKTDYEVVKQETNLTLHWAALKEDRTQ